MRDFFVKLYEFVIWVCVSQLKIAIIGIFKSSLYDRMNKTHYLALPKSVNNDKI